MSESVLCVVVELIQRERELGPAGQSVFVSVKGTVKGQNNDTHTQKKKKG